jgi:hypothetical protein
MPDWLGTGHRETVTSPAMSHLIVKDHRSAIIPTRTQEAPTVAGGNHAYAEPVQAGQQNYY